MPSFPGPHSSSGPAVLFEVLYPYTFCFVSRPSGRAVVSVVERSRQRPHAAATSFAIACASASPLFGRSRNDWFLAHGSMCIGSSGETGEWNAADEESRICELQREPTNGVLIFLLIVRTFNFCDDQSRPCREVTLLSKPIFHVVAQRHSGYFCPDLHQSVADRQRIVKHTHIREVAHAETVHPLQRAGVLLAVFLVLNPNLAGKHILI